MSESIHAGGWGRSSRSERLPVSCGECRRRKQKASRYLSMVPCLVGQVSTASSALPWLFLQYHPSGPQKQAVRRRGRSRRGIGMRTNTKITVLQCNQGQPCSNCARRFPPPVCEYVTHGQRFARPSYTLEVPIPDELSWPRGNSSDRSNIPSTDVTQRRLPHRRCPPVHFHPSLLETSTS